MRHRDTSISTLSLLGLLLVALPTGGCPDDPPTPGPEVGPSDISEDSEPDTDAESDGDDTSTCPSGPPKTWYRDSDGDGFGDPDEARTACEQPADYVANDDDCDNGNESIYPRAPETCDGVDEDCDGTPDAAETDAQSRSCSHTEGVCQGAEVRRCSSDGNSYATCDRREYGARYRASEDENWRCDGRDNDCDGSADEPCCPSGRTPLAATVGPMGTDQSVPRIAPTPEDAAERAHFAVAWAREQTVQFRQVDETGTPLGEGNDRNPGRDVRGLELVAHSDGYVAVAALASGNGVESELRAYQYSPTLDHRRTITRLAAAPTGGTVGPPDAAVAGGRVHVVFDRESTGDHAPHYVAFDIQSGQIAGGGARSLVASGGPGAPSSEVRPEIAVDSGTPTAAWWHPSAGQIRGVRIGGGSSSDRFHVALGRIPPVPEPIELIMAQGDLRLLYPQYGSATNPRLRLVDIPSGATGEIAGGTPLTGRTTPNRRPRATVVAPGDDAGRSRLLVAWHRGSRTRPAAAVGASPLDSIQTLDPRRVAQTAPAVPDLAIDGEKAGLVWSSRSNRSTDAEYAPVSSDGVPICTP